MDQLILHGLPTYSEACGRSELVVVKCGMNNTQSLLYKRRGPSFQSTPGLLPNTMAMLQRYYGPYWCRGPAPIPKVSNRNATCLKPVVLTNPKSVLKKAVSREELQQQPTAGNYRTKMLRIESDGLGWGFVVRGTGPCHVQTVAPHGPAAVAGMKVCQLLSSINNKSVLEMDYKAITRLIQTGPMKVNIEVMEVVTGTSRCGEDGTTREDCTTECTTQASRQSERG